VSAPGGPTEPDPTEPDHPQPADGWALDLTDTPAAGVADPAHSATEPASRRRRRGAVALVAAAVAAAVAGGAGLAWAAFNGDTGDQAARHVPAGVSALVQVDLDPSGQQKVEALRFISKLPDGDRSGDLREMIYRRLKESTPELPAWSEVSPWLGDRAGVAAFGEEQAPVFVLQVTDEAKARATLERTAGAGAVRVAEGWATLSDSREHLEAATAALARGSLADDPTYRRDVEALGDAGVFTGWADVARLAALTRQRGLRDGLLGTQLRGAEQWNRVAVVGRFTGGDAEVVVRATGPTGAPKGDAGAAVAALPADTVAALGVSGGGDFFRQQWEALAEPNAGRDALAEASRQTGLRLPDDVAALLGRRFALALGPAGASGEPVLGMRATADGPAVAGALERLLRFTDAAGLPLVRQDVPDGYALATTREQAKALAGAGSLGASGDFTDAVPDADGAHSIVYVDLRRLESGYAADAPADLRRTLSALRGIGLSATATADGQQLRLRVTTR
jgi:hypothetical protein